MVDRYSVEKQSISKVFLRSCMGLGELEKVGVFGWAGDWVELGLRRKSFWVGLKELDL